MNDVCKLIFVINVRLGSKIYFVMKFFKVFSDFFSLNIFHLYVGLVSLLLMISLPTMPLCFDCLLVEVPLRFNPRFIST